MNDSTPNASLIQRRQWLLQAAGWLMGGCVAAEAKSYLPHSKAFLGRRTFDRIVTEAEAGSWARLPMGERVARFGRAMVGIPYVGFTLEIDDHIESPSVNFNGLDCWTFFEIALGLARMVERKKAGYVPDDLLREIEWTRYRDGVCHGNYLDRIHYLDEWFRDNAKRGVIRDVTQSIGSVVPLEGRRIDEMTVLWKSYRYLRQNPELREGMARIEAELQTHPFSYIPKAEVAACEKRIQNGDIIGIVTHKPHVYCSHVGLALHSADGVCHFMHASATYKKVVVDKSISQYLASFKSHAGIVIARPLS